MRKTIPPENVHSITDLISRFGEVVSEDFFEVGTVEKQVTLDVPGELEEGKTLFTTFTTSSASDPQELSSFVAKI